MNRNYESNASALPQAPQNYPAGNEGFPGTWGKIGAGPPLVSRHFVNRCIQTILFALKIRFAIWKIFHNFVYADDFNK